MKYSRKNLLTMIFLLSTVLTSCSRSSGRVNRVNGGGNNQPQGQPPTQNPPSINPGQSQNTIIYRDAQAEVLGSEIELNGVSLSQVISTPKLTAFTDSYKFKITIYGVKINEIAEDVITSLSMKYLLDDQLVDLNFDSSETVINPTFISFTTNIPLGITTPDTPLEISVNSTSYSVVDLSRNILISPSIEETTSPEPCQLSAPTFLPSISTQLDSDTIPTPINIKVTNATCTDSKLPQIAQNMWIMKGDINTLSDTTIQKWNPYTSFATATPYLYSDSTIVAVPSRFLQYGQTYTFIYKKDFSFTVKISVEDLKTKFQNERQKFGAVEVTTEPLPQGYQYIDMNHYSYDGGLLNVPFIPCHGRLNPIFKSTDTTQFYYFNNITGKFAPFLDRNVYGYFEDLTLTEEITAPKKLSCLFKWVRDIHSPNEIKPINLIHFDPEGHYVDNKQATWITHKGNELNLRNIYKYKSDVSVIAELASDLDSED